MATSTRKNQKPTDADAAEAAKLLLWLRANRFGVVGVTVGKVTITCQDLAPLPAAKGGDKAKPEGPATIYEEFGGPAWANAQKQKESPLPPGDDGEDEDDD